MNVLRIVANLEVAEAEFAKVDAFYRGVFGLDVLMDHGWIRTYGADARMRVQLGFATEGGNGAPVPHLSVEVDDLDAALRRMAKAGVAIEYGPAHEAWGVRRFFVRDPLGRLVNVLQHE